MSCFFETHHLSFRFYLYLHVGMHFDNPKHRLERLLKYIYCCLCYLDIFQWIRAPAVGPGNICRVTDIGGQANAIFTLLNKTQHLKGKTEGFNDNLCWYSVALTCTVHIWFYLFFVGDRYMWESKYVKEHSTKSHALAFIIHILTSRNWISEICNLVSNFSQKYFLFWECPFFV